MYLYLTCFCIVSFVGIITFMLFLNSVSYVFLLLCTLCSGYSVYIVPNGTLQLP